MHYHAALQPPACLVDVSDIRKRNDLSPQARRVVPVPEGTHMRPGPVARRAVPLHLVPGSHRIDLFEKVGEKAPDTWRTSCARDAS